MNKLLEDKSKAVVEDIGPPKADLNPLFDAIQQLFTALIQLLRDKCQKTPSQALAEAGSDTIIARLEIRRAAVKAFGNRRKLRQYQGKVESGVKKIARQTNTQEMEQLYEEVPKLGNMEDE